MKDHKKGVLFDFSSSLSIHMLDVIKGDTNTLSLIHSMNNQSKFSHLSSKRKATINKKTPEQKEARASKHPGKKGVELNERIISTLLLVVLIKN